MIKDSDEVLETLIKSLEMQLVDSTYKHFMNRLHELQKVFINSTENPNLARIFINLTTKINKSLKSIYGISELEGV